MTTVTEPVRAAAPSSAASLARHVRPYAGAQLRNVTRLSDVMPHLDPFVLLHAGPPYARGELPRPVRNAARHALVYEGLAQDHDEAAGLLDRGRARLAPAQDYGVVTPLAQVVSRSMAVLHVGDSTDLVYAPLAEGPPPALRFGSADPQCVARTRACADLALLHLAPSLAERPVAIDAIVREALAAGDECHTRTGAANQALARALSGMDAASLDTLRANPGFVLPVLMAASAWALRRHAVGRPDAIVAGGGNGCRFGLRLARDKGWRTMQALPPRGPRLPGAPDATVLGAIGDSAVIDLCGLGGQALAWAPELAAEWQSLLPSDWIVRAQAVVDPLTGLVDAARVARLKQAPNIHLAMLDADGNAGLLGRGFYCPSSDLFDPSVPI